MPLIVLEGLDGAGKSTQVKQLRNLLESRGKECEYIHFPRFDAPVYGGLIARFLRGELGGIDSVDPYIVALLFAGDRAQAAGDIRRWLGQGRFVLLDRYVNSNIAYQCAKVSGRQRQEALKDWILALEYGQNDIPRPDVSVFLDVPFRFTQRNLQTQREGDDRGYLKGAEDIHEASLDFQCRVREQYLRIASEDVSLKVVVCADGCGEMGTPESTFAKIMEEIAAAL